MNYSRKLNYLIWKNKKNTLDFWKSNVDFFVGYFYIKIYASFFTATRFSLMRAALPVSLRR